MSDSRRRSSRRGKKLVSYSANDLVQIPHNSTTIIGRLAYKLTEHPSVRWLVSFDDIPSRKDEEIPEEAIGPVVGHIEAVPKTSSNSRGNGDTATVVTPSLDDSVASTANNDTVTTRSLRRKSNSGSNSSSSADDSTTKSSGKKRKGSSLPASIPKDEADSKTVVSQEILSLSPKVSGRERRSRRRQGLTRNEVRENAQVSSTEASVLESAKAGVPAVANGGLPLPDKRSAPNNSTNKGRSDESSKNKKAKIGSTDNPRARDKSDVLKVHYFTGTLYFYRGPQRHVEFIPKY
mmetsp:Transcript_22416/g.52913  ORF Transcript_22416/g.52913 Transcript_22416/m.52913 type:complete len:292 (+) Transcript_22416:296-1171(+)